MNLQEIKKAIADGKKVYWSNTSYEVIKDKIDQYFIECTNGSAIGLTWQDGTTLNGEEKDFFIGENQDNLNQIPEFTISLKSKLKPSERIQVKRSSEVADLAKKCFDADQIEWVESFVVIALSESNRVLGFYKISTGGTTQTICDPRVIFQFALLSNSSKIILAHNHPSGSLKPSRADEEMTQKLKTAGYILNIKVVEHVIVSSEEGYYSFADEGML